jgi:hypothetical protein
MVVLLSPKSNYGPPPRLGNSNLLLSLLIIIFCLYMIINKVLGLPKTIVLVLSKLATVQL